MSLLVATLAVAAAGENDDNQSSLRHCTISSNTTSLPPPSHHYRKQQRRAPKQHKHQDQHELQHAPPPSHSSPRPLRYRPCSSSFSSRRSRFLRATSKPVFGFFILLLFLCTTTIFTTVVVEAYPLSATSLALLSSSSSSSVDTLDHLNNPSNLPFDQHIGALLSNETVNPVDDNYGPLILDVGQRTVVSKQNAVLGTLLIVLGLVQVFFGFKLIRATLFLTGFLSWAILVMLLMAILRWQLAYLLFQPSHGYFWAWFLAGLVGAILSFRFWDLGVTFSGGFGGFALAMGIIAASNHSLTNVGRYILLAFLILLGAAIATFFERFSIILGTSFGGAFMFMYGVDEFVQVGYREMIVIFDFAGRTLTYHPNKKVFAMIGGSLALAVVGIAWEFWHHHKPLWVTEKALFRIYGRPFGKRPRKLVGQKISHRVSRTDWFTYLAGCLCLRRKTVEEVLYEGYESAGEEGAIEENGFVVVNGPGQQTRPSGPAPGSEQEEEGKPSHTTIVQLQDGSNDEKHSDSETVVHSDNSTSSKTPSSHAIDIKDDAVQNDDAEEEHSDESAVSLSTLAPVEIVIEETDYEDDGNGQAVPTGTHTESVTRVSDGKTLSESTTSTMQSSSRTEQHQHRTISTTTTTTTTTSRGEHRASHRAETSTSSEPSTGHLALPGLHRPDMAVVSESHHQHSLSSSSFSSLSAIATSSTSGERTTASRST